MRHPQVIAFKPIYAKITGSIEAALMLSQAEFCTTRKSNGRSFSKTREEWEQETGITYWKQKSARKILRSFPFWKEYEAGIPSRLYYKVDVEMLSKYVKSFEQKLENEYQEASVSKCDSYDDNYYQQECENLDNKIEEYQLTSTSENIQPVGVINSNKKEKSSPTIIGSIIENIVRDNNTITETECFGESGKNLKPNFKQRSENTMRKSNPEKDKLITEYEQKLSSYELMVSFNGSHEWYSDIIKSQKRFLIKSLASRLAQGKINLENLEKALNKSKTISDLLSGLESALYTKSEILKDMIFLYSDGLVSSWSRETKAIKSLISSIEDGIITLSEIDDCLIWIKNTMNYTMSLSSVIPSIQYFRKHRVPILGIFGRHMCTYSFNRRTVNTTSSPSANAVADSDALDGFFSGQRLRK